MKTREDKERAIRRQVDRLGRPSAQQLDKEYRRLERREAYGKMAKGILAGVFMAAAAAALLTNLWLTVLQVDGTSMNPLLQLGEVVVAAETKSPQNGDLIAFYHNNKLHIKRVIATAGQQVDISEDGTVTVNGAVLREPYVEKSAMGACDIDLPYLVPAETVFVLGDNRFTSQDSRSRSFGTVSKELIVGRVFVRVWPLNRLKVF